MRKIIPLILFGFVFLFFFPKGVGAAYLKFDKETVDASVGEEFQVKVMIDTEGEEVVSTDAYVSYDEEKLEATGVQASDFFDTVTYDLLTGKVYVAGMSDDIGVGKTGTGAIATITFKPKTSGSTTLAFICDPNATQTSKIIKVGVDAENIINCSSNKSLSVNIDESSGSSGSTDSGSNSDSSGNTAGASTGTTPSQLPKSGIFDNTLSFTLWGGAFLLFGAVLKVLFL